MLMGKIAMKLQSSVTVSLTEITARLRLRRILLQVGALTTGLFATSGAWAQCADNFNVISFIPGKGFQPVQALTPLGTGPSLGALTSTINTVNTAFLTGTTAFVSAPGNPQPDQQGGGAWERTIAGSVDTNTSSTGTLLSGPISFGPGFVPTGTQHCNTSTHQDYWGYQVGQDISILNSGATGQNFHVGVTAGYLAARNRDTTPSGSFTNPNTFMTPGGPLVAPTFFTPGGSFSESVEVPFVGVYGAYTKGNFFMDAQARWDFYQGSLSDSANGLSQQRLDARGFSVTGNVGYHLPLHNNWFIEPSAGVVWSRVSTDPLSVSGL